MPFRKSRRLLPFLALLPALAGALALPVLTATLAGCQRHTSAAPKAQAGDEAAPEAGRQSEAERTRAMEDKARQMEQKATEIQDMQGTEQEKIDAVNKLEQERQELNKTGGDGSATASPPPQ
jgi:TolA-binding protein